MENRSSIVRGTIPHGVKLEENVYVTMRDGIKIAVDIYHPEVDGRYPGILSMAPYIKEIQQLPPMLSASIEAGATHLIVPKGYVHVIAQIRGTGLSQGQYNFLDIKEQQDGYDLVEWIARQPWCNGNVATLGESYFAMVQYRLATQQPPHLKCMAVFNGGADAYRDFVYMGGLFNSGFLSRWGADTIHQSIWPGQVEGKLPPANLFADWLSHPEDGSYWWERSALVKYDMIKVPTLNMVVPIAPIHTRGQLDLYTKLKSPKKLLVLSSSFPHHNEVFLKSEQLNEQIIRWFDYWLKDINTGIMDEPEVAIFDDAKNEWRYENEYPLSRTQWTKFYLHSNSTNPATVPPYGLINQEEPGGEKPDRYLIPGSWKQLQAGKPVLAYATPPLKEDLRLWGPYSVVLYGSSTGTDTMWFVKIGDVDPSGHVNLLTQGNLQLEGHLKASFREVDESKSRPGQPFHPFQNPVPPKPNTIYEYQIEMSPIFHTFKTGHKLWIQIASEDLVYHGGIRTAVMAEMLPVPAENTIYHDSAHQSHLVLPVIPDAPIVKPMGPPLSEIKWPN